MALGALGSQQLPTEGTNWCLMQPHNPEPPIGNSEGAGPWLITLDPAKSGQNNQRVFRTARFATTHLSCDQNPLTVGSTKVTKNIQAFL